MTLDPRFERWLAPRPADAEDTVGLGLAHEPVDNWLFVPGWAFGRILGIAHVYGLHLLGALSFYDDAELDAVQCQGLPEELEFVATLVNDPAIPAVASQVAAIAARCARTPGSTLKIEFD
jgi:hypothetical protein